jgi:hypothetical protein
MSSHISETFPFLFVCFILLKKMRYLKGGLKYHSYYNVPYRVGWHAMGLVFKAATPSQLMTNNTTPNEYTYASTSVFGYIMSNYALKCHHRASAITLGEHT